MHGEGILTSHNGEQYSGSFVLNVKEGYGTLMTSDSREITGTFSNGKPNGENMTINYPNGDVYTGSMFDGRIEGHGILNKKDVSLYEGQFQNENYHGQGKYKAGHFEYEGIFEHGTPTVFPNQISFKSLMPEEPEDPKAKKAPAAKKGQEEDDDPNPNKLKFQVGKDPLHFEIRFEFQGPAYVSQEPPTEEEQKLWAAE